MCSSGKWLHAIPFHAHLARVVYFFFFCIRTFVWFYRANKIGCGCHARNCILTDQLVEREKEYHAERVVFFLNSSFNIFKWLIEMKIMRAYSWNWPGHAKQRQDLWPNVTRRDFFVVAPMLLLLMMIMFTIYVWVCVCNGWFCRM